MDHRRSKKENNDKDDRSPCKKCAPTSNEIIFIFPVFDDVDDICDHLYCIKPPKIKIGFF